MKKGGSPARRAAPGGHDRTRPRIRKIALFQGRWVRSPRRDLSPPPCSYPSCLVRCALIALCGREASTFFSRDQDATDGEFNRTNQYVRRGIVVLDGGHRERPARVPVRQSVKGEAETDLGKRYHSTGRSRRPFSRSRSSDTICCGRVYGVLPTHRRWSNRAVKRLSRPANRFRNVVAAQNCRTRF